MPVPEAGPARTVTDEDLRGLLAQARGLGLRVRRSGDRLRVESERDDKELAQKILDHKARVVALLQGHPSLEFDAFTDDVVRAFEGTVVDDDEPELGRAAHLQEAETGVCSCCGGSRWWKRVETDGPWVCGSCHPPLLDESRIAWVEVDE